MILNKDDLPKAVKRDLFNLVGRKILDLNNLDVVRDDTISNKSPSSQIVQSNLLSGGLSQHLYGYFTPESLQKMLEDSEFGKNPDLTEHLKNTLKNVKDGKLEAQLNEEDTKFLSIINPGKNKDIDFLIECLQVQLKKKGGLLASISETGKEAGMQLTRAAFSVMIKFAGLLEKVDSIVDTLDMEQMTGNIPTEVGPERNIAIIKAIDSVEGSGDITKCWANATQMRRWLT